MIEKQIKSFSKDTQKKAEAIGFNYLEQKYSGQTITEETIENEYQEGIESGAIDYYSENIEKQETPEEVETEEETDFSEEEIQQRYCSNQFSPCSIDKWQLSEESYKVATKAVNLNKNERYQTFAEFCDDWKAANHF